jgi:hypothetical protein
MHTLILMSGLLACRSAESPERSAPAPEARRAGAAAAEPDPEPAPDPELEAKLRDLDELCEAVDHDYGDGTLGDYYADVKPRTAWGKAQMKAGNESIQPGRLLEKAVAELSPGAKHPSLAHCRKLLDYLDEVE